MPDRNIWFRIYPMATFERDPAAFMPEESLNDLEEFHPDIVVFQLGENVELQEKSLELFKKNTLNLFSFLKEMVTLKSFALHFLSSLEKNDLIKSVALGTNSFLVDLSHLPLLNSQDYAKNEKNYAGDRSVWKEEEIGIHSGDYGMENIAYLIFITINAVLMIDNMSK